MLLMVFIILVAVAIGGSVYLITQKKNFPQTTQGPGTPSAIVPTVSIMPTSSASSSVSSSSDIDVNLQQLNKEGATIDSSLNDTPVDVMQ